MKQIKKFQKNEAFGLIFGLMLLSTTSCIDQLYDLSNGISKEMALGGDSLSIPIGSTDTIRLGDYLTQDKLSMLKNMEDGGFGIMINDSLEPIAISVDQSNLSIADQTISKTVSVDFGDIDLSSFKIPGIAVENTVNLGLGNYSLGSFDIPGINESTSTNAGMSGYGLSAPAIADKPFNSDANDILDGIALPPDPGGSPVLLPISDPAPISIETTGDINYAIDVPSGITNISDVVLSPGAILEVSIELSGAATTLTSGAIVPDFDISTDGLFVFETPPTGGLISFEQKDSLTITNSYKVKKTYNLVGLNTPSNPTGSTLNISKTMETLGNIALKNASVMSDKLGDVGKMDLLVKMTVKNVTISSMEFDIPKLNATIPPNTTEINISNTVPTQLNKLNKVYFNNPASISINLSTANLPEMESSIIKIESLTIDFPEQFVFEPTPGLTGNTFTISNETFNTSTGRTIHLILKELDMSKIAISGGAINWNGVISYSGNISFDGRIKSNKVPAAGSDAKMNVTFSSNMSFKSAEVTTNPISVSVPQVDIPIGFTIDTKDLIKRLNSLVLKPNTKIRMDLVKPDLPLDMVANNLVLSFPDLFVFDVAYPGNNYVINGPLPDSIVLVLKEIAVNRDLVDGKLTLNENIRVSGGVGLNAGTVNSLDIEAMNTKSMTVKAKTSDLSIESTSIMLNNLETNFSDSVSLDIEQNGIPAQLVSLDSILLKDGAQIKINVDISNMPDLSNPLNANVVINFPEMLMFSNGVNANNQLVINEPFVDGKLSKTLGIRGIKFDGAPLNGKIGIHEKLKYTAGVSVTSPTVNSDDLMGTEISVAVNAILQDISFSKAYGLVDPNVEPIDQQMNLGDIPEFLQSDDVVLDITKPVIALKTESNLGLPIIASVRVTPLINGVENTSSEQSFELNIPKTDSPSVPRKTNFWIAPDSAGMPAGFTYIETRIQDLFKKIPSGVKFHASVASDQSVQHFFDLGSTYTFKLGYDVTVPFAFGEDMNIKINQKLENIDPKIGEMAASVKGIEVLGEVINSIPLELELALIPLDADGYRIPIDTVTQIINAGAYDGSAVASSLTIKLEDPDGLLKELRAFELIFTARSNSTVAGAAIKPENFIKADLKIRITGGIDVSSFLDKEE